MKGHEGWFKPPLQPFINLLLTLQQPQLLEDAAHVTGTATVQPLPDVGVRTAEDASRLVNLILSRACKLYE